MTTVAKRLTAKQRRFVDEYLVDLSASAAARRAGYSQRSAGAIGWEILKKPEIAEAIQKARTDLSVRTGVSQDFVIERWRIESMGAGPDTNASARIKAADSIAKYLGMWSDQNTGQNTGTAVPQINIQFGVKVDNNITEAEDG